MPVSLQLASWDSTTSDSASLSSMSKALAGLQSQVAGTANFGNASTILFANHGDIITGLYVGSSIDSTTAVGELANIVTSASLDSGLGEALAVQACNTDQNAAHTMGLIVTRTRSSPLLQSALQSWANATCVEGYHRVTSTNITVSELPTSIATEKRSVGLVEKREGTCDYVLVVSGDSCASLVSKCGITAADLAKYNPSNTLCSSLAVGQPICCSKGSLPDLTPQPNKDGTCYSYTVKDGDYCALLAEKNYITVDKIEKYNAETWGWMGCKNLQLDGVICLSSGKPPMPGVLSNAVCGPQVEGSTRPSDWSDIGSLNPCPLNACCNIWGQCGITPDFCTPSKSTTGAPGTAAEGEYGCISNCGTSITNNDAAPSELISIGYYEAFGVDRTCLAMQASQLPSSYSHVHFAFGQISSNFDVDISGYKSQFEAFANQKYFKRILSFGGWSFSTDLDSYPIFRDGVTDANRLTFAQNVAAFVEKYNLDGVDFDWEYPSAPDLPGIPAGSKEEGPNYLSFLKTVRSLLPSNKSLSIAAPASYWYLKGFPIAEMAEVLDYIVFMTYDLHGQWDWDNSFVNPGCENGNCLRSHVNLTETEYALAMITKAGVPANKVVVGIASYGRSFGMEDPSCTGPSCLFTGPNSTATPGDCTNTAGYISQAELSQLTSGSNLRRDVTSWYDSDSDSDMMTYGDGTWVAYMSQATKASRIKRYASYGFKGSVEWALDLAQFVLGPNDEASKIDINKAKETFTDALALSDYDISEFDTYNFTDLATRLFGFDGCTDAQEKAITSGWQQSWKIMNHMYQVAKKGIDFNEAAAVEFLGPPAYNQQEQSDFIAAFKQLSTIQPGWGGWFAWKLAVRCDDFKYMCPCNIETGVIAYTVQKDPKHQEPSISFCPKYFNLPTLDSKIKEWANKETNIPSDYADMDNYYPNQGATWIHELLHVDWASLKGDPHITDLKVGYNTIRGRKWFEAYGPTYTKSLARLGGATGFWTLQNADSLTLYALAKYVQKQLGNIYPHLPLAPAPPIGVELPLTNPGVYTIYPNGTGELDSEINVWSPSDGICAAVDDVDTATKASSRVTVNGIPVESEYPSDYLSSWSSWAGLTPTTTSTTTTSTTKTTSTVPTATETGYNCKGSIRCGTFHNLHKFCDMAKSFLTETTIYGTTDKDTNSGTCYTDGKNAGFGCGVFVEGDNCQMNGDQMAAAYDHIFQKTGGNCGICGHAFFSDGCKLTVNYVSGCQRTNGILEAFIGNSSDITTASLSDAALSSTPVKL
ncbi:hypothetical protein EYZ11_010716 [Aspergillus tanneri]|uniref:chitinase n=1 Tax=Aspergillus tanneri TaxID=1220188 RepID=A0A4S3J576_9EURO|nr:hypothetical protein EYZ11_010716 [Aspergillus tanneri]